MADEMVIFTRTYDLLQWIVPKGKHFPKLYRTSVTQRLLDATLDFQETLYDALAHEGNAKQSHLRRADAHLNKVRLYLRLAYSWHWLTDGQYQHVSAMVAEIGKLLGGWLKR